MPASSLIDTGAMLALLHEDDRWHERCRATFHEMRLPLATSAAVLTEVFHLVGRGRHRISGAWTFVRSGAVTVLPIDDHDMAALQTLMSRYADRPMDFADATLVHLAERETLNVVFTLDHADFETYRIGGRGRFRIVPGRIVPGAEARNGRLRSTIGRATRRHSRSSRRPIWFWRSGNRSAGARQIDPASTM